MIDKLPKKECTGCGLCVDVCVHKAISLVAESKTGFLYPQIDNLKCTSCNRCEDLCPSLNILKVRRSKTLKAIAAVNNNIETRFESTSGGVFSLVAENFFASGDLVCGAVWNNKYEVIHFLTNNKSDLQRLRLSKYVQSDCSNVYQQVKKELKNGKRVLFVGCPCQVSAINNICSNYDNLFTIDLVCKGVPSPLFWRKYINHLEQIYGKKVISHRAKDKEYGWKRLGVRIDFEDGTAEYLLGSNDVFANLYSGNYFMRDSCYNCKFRGLERCGDISLGDCWGIDHIKPEMDDDCGTSLILINSEKGKKLYDEIRHECLTSEIDVLEANSSNSGISKDIPLNLSKREAFFDDLNNDDFSEVVNKYKIIDKSLKNKIKPYYHLFRTVIHVTRLRPRSLFQFFKYNFFSKHVKSSLKDCALLIPSTYCVFQLEKNAIIELHGSMIIGDARLVSSRRESRLLMKENSKIIVNKWCHISEGADIEIHKNGMWEMDEFYSNFDLEISCGELIKMNGIVGCGRKVTIRDYNGHIIAKKGFKIANPVRIDNHTWLCSGCSIMPGVHIQTGAIISANSYCASNVPPYTIISGKPAVIMGKEVRHKI